MIYKLLGRLSSILQKSPACPVCPYMCAAATRAHSTHECERKERDNVHARQWSDVRSPVQRPGLTCARTKINCNQHRCINQLVRRVGSERRIGIVGTRQSSALPFKWFVDGTLYANRSARETLSFPARNVVDVKGKGGTYREEKFCHIDRSFASLIRK